MTNPNDSVYPKMNELLDCDGKAVIVYSHAPLTKREYFAAMAMQGIVSTGLLTMQSYGLEFTWEHRNKYLSQISVRIADALIEELNIVKSDESDQS